MTYRAANPETMERIAELRDLYQASLRVAAGIRRGLDDEIKSAKSKGHSYQQLSSASGLSIATIQEIVGLGRQRKGGSQSRPVK
jgi:hypothetical protein